MRKNYKNFYHSFQNPYKRRGFSTIAEFDRCTEARFRTPTNVGILVQNTAREETEKPFQNPYKRRGFSTGK